MPLLPPEAAVSAFRSGLPPPEANTKQDGQCRRPPGMAAARILCTHIHERELMHSLPIIVFSHLRWDFVFQRPQHLLSRLAKHRRIVFIEEPIHADAEAHWEKS